MTLLNVTIFKRIFLFFLQEQTIITSQADNIIKIESLPQQTIKQEHTLTKVATLKVVIDI